jgi:lipopolysaccharide heptosyltransferase II
MKILIFTKNWLGDILFELPAIQAMRENFPQARIVVLGPARCQEILAAVPFLDEVRTFDERASERALFSKFRFIAWLWRERFDKVFLFHRSFTRSLLAWLGGIPERIGYRTPKRGWLLTTAVDPPPQAIHQTDYFLVLLKWAGLRVKFGSEYQFFYRPEDETEARRLLEKNGLEGKSFVAFHIGANWEPKRWPFAHFARLADLLAEAYSSPVVLTGALEDEETAQKIIVTAKATPPISLCGRTSLGVLGAVYKSAAFVVSSDSGPLHIASGVGTPVVALFGPTCPKMTGPHGTGKKVIIQYVPDGYSIPWKGKTLPRGGWMERISPEEVMRKIKQENLWSQKKEKIYSSSR